MACGVGSSTRTKRAYYMSRTKREQWFSAVRSGSWPEIGAEFAGRSEIVRIGPGIGLQLLQRPLDERQFGLKLGDALGEVAGTARCRLRVDGLRKGNADLVAAAPDHLRTQRLLF